MSLLLLFNGLPASDAFQPGAFQTDAFQTSDVIPSGRPPGHTVATPPKPRGYATHPKPRGQRAQLP